MEYQVNDKNIIFCYKNISSENYNKKYQRTHRKRKKMNFVIRIIRMCIR